MTSTKRFSDVSAAYNAHVANLDQARCIFEEEVTKLNEYVYRHLAERYPRATRKLRWGAPKHWSTAREVTWLHWMAGCRVRLDVKPPGYKVFRKGAAFLYFQSLYAESVGAFVFEARLENQNTANTEIDEEAYAVIEAEGGDRFPRAEHLKRNTTVLFRCDLGDGLFDDLNDYVDRAMEVIEAAIDRLYPDSAYPTEAAGDEAPGDGGTDDAADDALDDALDDVTTDPGLPSDELDEEMLAD